MKRSSKIITVLVLSFGVVGGAVAFGKHKFSDPAVRADYAVGYISEELELDAIQKQNLDALKDQLIVAGASMKNNMSPLHTEVRSMISADTFDQARALEIVNQKTMAMNEFAPELVTALGGFLDSLNTEQKAEIIEFIDHKRTHRSRNWH